MYIHIKLLSINTCTYMYVINLYIEILQYYDIIQIMYMSTITHNLCTLLLTI